MSENARGAFRDLYCAAKLCLPLLIHVAQNAETSFWEARKGWALQPGLWSEREGRSFPSATSPCRDPEAVLILNNALCLLWPHTCIIYLHYALGRGMSERFVLIFQSGFVFSGKRSRSVPERGQRVEQQSSFCEEPLFRVSLLACAFRWLS